ncbi:hypothetical protein ABZ678_14865 [Streptomyces hirsutus]|uniref:hypothetical protein n=1 Tax=Streptomyces hirsutus TaxID=35620 RepID=UPI0033DE99EC
MHLGPEGAEHPGTGRRLAAAGRVPAGESMFLRHKEVQGALDQRGALRAGAPGRLLARSRAVIPVTGAGSPASLQDRDRAAESKLSTGEPVQPETALPD